MSLQTAAQHLAAHGRGSDDHLVHMSSNELAGLQALAQAHGGSLTRNPHTGLPEAGFLDSILPTVIGAGLAFATDGMSEAITPGLIGAGVGGLEALRTGNLGKGIMAGLGAYGGAGLEGAAASQGMLPGSAQAVNTQVPTAAGLAGPAPEGMATGANARDDLPLNTGNENARDQLLARTVAPDQAAAQLAQTNPAPAGGLGDVLSANNYKYLGAAAAPSILDAMQQNRGTTPTQAPGMIHPYTFNYNKQTPSNMVGTKYTPGQDTSERLWFQPQYTAGTPYTPVAGQDYAAGGVTTSGPSPAPVEQMSDQNAVGQNTGFPMAYNHTNAFATPWQSPESQNVLSGPGDVNVDPYTGEQKLAVGGSIKRFDMGGIAQLAQQAAANSGNGGNQEMNGQNILDGGIAQYIDQIQQQQPSKFEYLGNNQYKKLAAGGQLGGYSDGGRMLKGPGDGMSDSIPASIGHKQPARLADGEFVVPADVVSHLGNGSTDAGAKQLYAMMDKIRQARTGRKEQGKQIDPKKYLPA